MCVHVAHFLSWFLSFFSSVFRCAPCVFPFPQHLVGSRPPRLIPHTGPPISSPLFLIRSLVQGAHHGRVYFHSMNRLCIPFTPPPLSVCCSPPPFTAINTLGPCFSSSSSHSLAFKAELRDIVITRGTRFISQRWWCKLGRRKNLVFKEVQVPFGIVDLRVHDVLFLSRLFLDLLDLCHVLDTHYLVVSPLSSSILTSGLSFGCTRLLLTMYL